jgi:hypothetical protein
VPSQSFTHTAVAHAPRPKVWKALDQPETWETIGGVDRVLDPVIDEAGRLRGFDFEIVAGGRRYQGRATPLAREEGELMAWNVVSTEVRGSTTVQLSDDGAGTRIRVTLKVEAAGMLSVLFFPVVAAAVGNGLPGAVESFAASLS